MNLRLVALVGVVLLGIDGSAQPIQHDPLALRSATPSQPVVMRYGKLELALDLAATYDNPFDSGEIDVYAIFTSPGGNAVRVNGFLDQPFTRKLEGGAEKIEPAGDPAWKIRFSPDTLGRWRYLVFARDRTGRVGLPEAGFDVSQSTAPGFIRRSQQNPRVFAYDDGRPFFAVGENVCWGGGRGSFDYDDWLTALGQAGGNWIRIWMSSWNCALEWSRDAQGDWRSGQYHGVGYYSLGNAWKLDTILDLAERNGISVMLCFGTYGEFKEGGYFNEGQWKANPYNAANGGPCAKPADFWTDEKARRLYQRRLRYIAARYGHRTCIQSWELWNEEPAPAPWVAEMARCLKGTGEFQGQGLDPYHHLLSTTYGNPEVWRIPEIDFTQTHSYGKGDIADHAPVVHRDAEQHAVYGKPHLVGEFGIDWRAADGKYDPDGQGVDLHNALWAAALSGDAGGAMIWWWDNYIHPKKLYGQFAALRKFADAVPWTAGEWKPIEADASGVSIYGLVHGRTAVLWAQNPGHNWKNVFEKKAIAAVPSREITVRGLATGRYTVEWWDTAKGTPLKREMAEGTPAGLSVRLPDLETDIAARIEPQP